MPYDSWSFTYVGPILFSFLEAFTAFISGVLNFSRFVFFNFPLSFFPHLLYRTVGRSFQLEDRSPWVLCQNYVIF